MDSCRVNLNQTSENFPPETPINSEISNLIRLDETQEILLPNLGKFVIETPKEVNLIHNSSHLLSQFPQPLSPNSETAAGLSSQPICLDEDRLLSMLHHKLHGTDDSSPIEEGNLEDDLYTREAKTTNAWLTAETTATVITTVAPAESAATVAAVVSSMEHAPMEVLHQSAKRLRSPPPSPGRMGTSPSRESVLDTSFLTTTTSASEEPTNGAVMMTIPADPPVTPRQPQEPRNRRQRREQELPTSPELSQPPSVDGTSTTVRQICQLIQDFRVSLALKMGDILPSTSLSALRLSLEGMSSTVIIALVGLEKSLQPLCRPSETPLPTGAPLLLLPPSPPESGFPGTRSTLTTGIQDSVPLNSPALLPSPPTMGAHKVSTSSWAKIVANITPAAPTATSPSTNRGQLPHNGIQTSPGRHSPSRAKNQTPGHSKPSAQTAGPPPRRGLRALLAPTPPTANGSVSPPAAEDIQKVLFAPAAIPAPAAMETEDDAPRPTRKKVDEAVTYLHVTCPNFSAAARKEPREAWRLLLLAQSKTDSPRLRPLDILPVSATAAEIFILESQLPVYREALQKVLLDSPPPLTEAADFRRRATAYRNSYFKSYRLATLHGFAPELRADFLFSLWNEVLNPTGPPPSKYKNLQWIVKQDLLELNLLSDPTAY